MLIVNGRDRQGTPLDLRIEDGMITALGTLRPQPGEAIFDARGGSVLPGLHDHHLHLAATAAALESVHCGPPDVMTPAQFAERLQQPGEGWLRATGYHESVYGMLDAALLDQLVPDRPLRVQHRSGRMWFFNSRALDHLLTQQAPPPGLERQGGHYTGRLFDDDEWLRAALGSAPPSLRRVGRLLAQAGVTGVSDLSPRNDASIAAYFAAEQRGGALPQRLVVAGSLELAAQTMPPGMVCGPVKLHLHEAELPEFETTVALIRAAHAQQRNLAVHCVTATELVFALAAWDEAGVRDGDRVEHASIAAGWAVEKIAQLGLIVVAQPHFVSERGDQYLVDVDSREQADLYRLRTFLDAGVALAGGSDAPFGRIDPWASIAAAVSRRTASGQLIGADEALTPDEALDLYLADPQDLRCTRNLRVGAPADLCVLRMPWLALRDRLDGDMVRATFIDGAKVFDADDGRSVQYERRVEATVDPHQQCCAPISDAP